MINNDEVANLAALILAFRRTRTEELPRSLFGEPGWDFLLELFIADARGVRMTGRQITERFDISDGAASRWLKHLAAEDLVIGDGDGDLDDELTLSGTAMAKMERLMEKANVMKTG